MSDSSAPFAFEAPNFPDEDDEDFDDEIEDLAEEVEPAEAGNRIDGGTAASVLEYIARSIVEDPDAVVLETDRSRGQTRLSLHVAPSDMGRVIGKRGRVAQAIRSVVRAAAARDGGDASVDIVD
jgi:uncharacterized protein